MNRVVIEVDVGLEAFADAAGVLRFESTMTADDGEVIKSRRGRDVRRLVLADGRSLYVKRYHGIGLGEALGLRARGQGSPMRREWTALQRLSALGVAAPRPAVCAEERRSGLVRRGYLVTHGIAPSATCLEEALDDLAADGPRRRRLVSRLARTVRTMHHGGVNHRDLYLAHLFVDRDDRIWVMDLDRADVREHVPERWLVKDLAGLQATAPERVFSVRDRLRFLAVYRGGERAGVLELAAAVRAKARVIRRHVARQVARGRANFHLPE